VANSLFQQIEQLLHDYGADKNYVAVCTNIILVTEWTDGAGVHWIEEHRSAEIPIWRREGILNYVLQERAEVTESDVDE